METASLLICFAGLILYFVVKIGYAVWWRPRSLEKLFRKQGIRGNSYKLLYGDKEEMKKSTQEALPKPMTLKHQIAPLVSPFFVKMVQKYGKVSLSWIGTTPRLIVGDAELMRLILINKNSHFVKPPRNPLVSLLQLGILTLEGGKWTTRRKLILHAFQLEKLKAMVRAAFSISCCSLIERWQKLIGHQESLELDVVPEFEFLAGDVISRTAFGSSYQEGKKIIELQKEQAVLAVEANNSIYIPGLRYCCVYIFIPTKKNKRRYHLYNEIKQLLRDMIHKKEQAMKMDELGSDDLLSLLLQCKEQGDNGLTVDDIIEECKLFYFAGQETTANLLTWTMIVLSMHPNWQEKARDEVLRICGKVTPDFEAIKQLKIVNIVLQEVLRLYPPFPGLLRYTACETSLGGISIPAGVDIYLPVLLVHGDSNIWGEDAEEFNPERFSEGVSKASKDQAAFYPFGWGPRICLGQNFAMIEAKMALAMVLQHFSFELSPSYAHAPCSELTVCPQHGAPIMLHRL